MSQVQLRPSREAVPGPASLTSLRQRDAHADLASPVQQHLRGMRRQGHALASLLLLLLAQLHKHSLALQRSCARRIRGMREKCRGLQQGLLLHCGRVAQALDRLQRREASRGLLGAFPLASISDSLSFPAQVKEGVLPVQGPGAGRQAEGGAWKGPVRIEALYVSTCSHYTPNVLTFGYAHRRICSFSGMLTLRCAHLRVCSSSLGKPFAPTPLQVSS